jgi:hypothetical protein
MNRVRRLRPRKRAPPEVLGVRRQVTSNMCSTIGQIRAGSCPGVLKRCAMNAGGWCLLLMVVLELWNRLTSRLLAVDIRAAR